MERPKTIILDIDGCLIPHVGPLQGQALADNLSVLPGVYESLNNWDAKGYKIILITGRRESQRIATEKQLCDLGIAYDQLIMGAGSGVRVLINDKKPDSDEDTAAAVNVPGNSGLKEIGI